MSAEDETALTVLQFSISRKSPTLPSNPLANVVPEIEAVPFAKVTGVVVPSKPFRPYVITSHVVPSAAPTDDKDAE